MSNENTNTLSSADNPPRCAAAKGSEARCPKCNGVGYHVRVRNFDDEDADVWECQSPLCTAYGLLWHTPREKDECGKLRCALIALVKAEEATIDRFTAKEIDDLERALDRANRVLYPERYPQNTKISHEARTRTNSLHETYSIENENAHESRTDGLVAL